MKIIRGNADRLLDVVPLFDAYRVFYGQASDLNGAKAFLETRMKNKQSTIFIAYENDIASGFTQLFPVFTSVGMKRAYILNDLFVDPDYRRRGIGEALMKEAFQFCEIEQAGFVTLQTHVNNHTAKALYENVGMQLNTTFDGYIKYF